MKKLLNKGLLAVAATSMTAFSAFAEGATSTGITYELVSPYVTEGKNVIIAVLTGGAVIMACFYVWRLIVRALKATSR